jgi:hypothetical protein
LSSVAGHSPPAHASDQRPTDTVAANTETLVRRSMASSSLIAFITRA